MKMDDKLFSIKVLTQDMLRDMILDHVIHDGNQLSEKDLRSCRLVSKDWLHSTSRCLHRARKPHFQLHLTAYNSVPEATHIYRTKKLYDFIETITSPLSLEKHAPLLKVKLGCDFFRHKNLQSLTDCLTYCGNNLIELEIFLPADGGSMMFILPELSFPKLQKFSVYFINVKTPVVDSDEERVLGVGNGTYLLHQIFSGCQQLETVKFRSNFMECIPHNFERLIVPSTISKLELSCWMLDSRYLELLTLTANAFPNLQILFLYRLHHMENYVSSDLMSDIFASFRKTLTHFRTSENYHVSQTRKPTFFDLPVMPQLEIFESNSFRLELRLPEHYLEVKLQKLRKLCLESQTVIMFYKWTEGTFQNSVKELTVSLVENNVSDELKEVYVDVRSEYMQRISKAFPNVQTMQVTVCGMQLCGLRFAFQNMKRLQTLKIIVREHGKISNSDCWDGLFMGTPAESAGVLRAMREHWREETFKNESPSSIINLTELRKLSLRTIDGSDKTFDLADSLISDSAFQYGFYQMPSLVKLELEGRFKASPEVIRDWVFNGRKIICDRKVVKDLDLDPES